MHSTVDSTTGDERLADGDSRIDSVLRRLAAAPAQGLPLPEGTRIAGRYVVERRLGRGGMGVVYSAHDRELERRVAIKLHRSSADPHAAARMLREARAMARLAHPNVVAVHEVGEHERQIFIVMEWVDGLDLHAWLGAAAREPAAIVEVFIAAGEGLAAAHAVGLVHRDFKPSNVLIGSDGRVRVADFGLARATGPAPTIDNQVSEETADNASPAAPTREGAIAGTPGYMSPEQAEGGPVDARSDQYSFCVALWAAVHLELPRPGVEPATKLSAQQMQALRRGLSPRPEARFPDMLALLDALRPEHARRRRLHLLAGGVLVGVAALSVALGVMLAPARGVSCSAAEWQPAAILPEGQVSAMAGRFAAAGGPYAAEAWPRVERALTGYASDLSEGAAEACADTHARGVQSAALLDLRMACLTRARREFAARVAALATVERDGLAEAVPLATGLPDIARCSDGEALRAGDRPAPADAAGVAAAEEALAAARALLLAGDHRGARARAESLAADVAALADPRLVADQRRLAGEALLVDHDVPAARSAFEDGYLSARTAGDELRAARLAAELAELQTRHTAEHRDALMWTRIAGGELARGGGGDRSDRVDLLVLEGSVRAGLGELGAALERYEAAESAIEQHGSPRPEHLALVLSHKGVTLEHLGRFDAAIAAQERSLAILRESLGAHHPRCVNALTLIGTALAGAGRLAEAEARYEEAIALGEAIHGADHPALAVPLADLAVLDGTRGRFAPAIARLERVLQIHEALAEPDPSEIAATLAMLGEYHSVAGDPQTGLAVLDRALALERATFGDDHARVAECRMRRAQVLADTGEVAEARSEQLAAAAQLERTLGPDSPMLADSLMIAGDNSVALGDLAQAEPLLRRSLAIWERIGRDNPQAMSPATSLGAVLVDLGRAAEAVPWLERAVTIREAEQGAPWTLAESQWQLARALWEVGEERPRARTLAERARASLTTSPDPLTPDRAATIAAWLQRHPAN